TLLMAGLPRLSLYAPAASRVPSWLSANHGKSTLGSTSTSLPVVVSHTVAWPLPGGGRPPDASGSNLVLASAGSGTLKNRARRLPPALSTGAATSWPGTGEEKTSLPVLVSHILTVSLVSAPRTRPAKWLPSGLNVPPTPFAVAVHSGRSVTWTVASSS